MTKINKNKYSLFIIAFVIFLILPFFAFGQVDVLGEDVLLKEYFFPISSYEKEGTPLQKRGTECEGYKLYYDDEQGYLACPDLPPFDDEGEIKEWVDGAGVLASKPAKLRYNFNVTEQDDYAFKIRVSNDQDNFENLTVQQIDFILDDKKVEDLDAILAYIGEGISKDDLTALGTSEMQIYNLVRSFVFSVYVDGEEAENKKGFIIVKNTDPSEVKEGEILIDNLSPGNHTIHLHFLSDYWWDFSDRQDPLPEYLNNFTNADLNNDQILDTNPVVHSVSIDGIVPADDIIGVRIYQNLKNKDPLTWYNENVVNPSPAVERITIDGYDAVRDDRTIYINAANLVERNVCLSGPDDGKECGEDADCAEEAECGLRKFFFTNIYVIAYNQAAATPTVDIFNQMLENWNFNVNLIEKVGVLGVEKIKEQLRRDTIRLSDLNDIKDLLRTYYNRNGQYPTLEAGTFVSGHSISIWPSWQAALGNQLGAALPVDPLNIMSTENRGPYDCQDSIEQADCQNICSRDEAGNPLTGCPADQQCVDDQYCSICPPGYDEETCWDEINASFAYGTHSDCDENLRLNGSFNLGGTECEYDGAYVYQYTALDLDDDGKSGDGYLLNYRLEYAEEEICSPGQCFFANRCYQPGTCLAGCFDNNNNGVIEDEECEFPEHKNVYCYLGKWTSSCGDGFVQERCGEACDPNRPLAADESWCDQQYGEQDWHNEENISGSCSPECEWQEFGLIGYMPQSYTPQVDDIDCGGYCGDKIQQALYGEQCDLGFSPAPLKRPEQGGPGGIIQSLQYMCSGVSAIGETGEILDKTGSECTNFADDHDKEDFFSCSPPLDSERVSLSDSAITSLGGFKVSYEFNIEEAGNYTFKLQTANSGDKINNLTDEQIDYLFFLKNEGTENLYNLTPEGGLSIPEYGDIAADDGQRNNLLRSLIFSVYLDDDDEENKIGSIVVPANNENQIQSGSISVGGLTAGQHTIYLHFVGDHFWLLFSDLNLPDYLDNFSNVDLDEDQDLDINPIIYSVSLFSPELDVGDCQTYGGWCGDGIVQSNFGEQCDIKNYSPPFPEETTSLVNGVRPQYKCGNDPVTGKICQYRGGYCGDGIIQEGFGENCDDRVGFSCTTDADCGAGGFCANNTCQSFNCNDVCQATFCGDGIVQRPNSEGLYEICDWGDDPLCAFDCQHIKMGGECNHDSSSVSSCDPETNSNCLTCDTNLSCTIRNFGDAGPRRCLGTRGSMGCSSNSDCILSYYCDLTTTRCQPEISTYLKYHSKEKTKEPLYTLPPPSPIEACDPTDTDCLTYDVNISECPDLVTIITEQETYYLADLCTGINWSSTDNISRPQWDYQNALENACIGATRMPTISELYSLVRQTGQGLLYADKEKLRLCPANCTYDENEADLCSDCPDDNYLYWSNTCVAKDDEDNCTKALAVNFKYGSIEEYPTSSAKFKVRCLKDTACGNGVIEEGESCEFYVDMEGNLLEQEIARQCTEFGYDGGFLHCDQISCTFKKDDCYFNSGYDKSCEDICQAEKGLACESVGLNITEKDDVNFAGNRYLMNIDSQGNYCEKRGNIGCDYEFVNRERNCYDPDTGQYAPFNSEYSYCNCKEEE